MARQTSVTLTAHIAWWFKWYVTGVYLTALLTGLEPSPAKMQAAVRRAVSWKSR